MPAENKQPIPAQSPGLAPDSDRINISSEQLQPRFSEQILDSIEAWPERYTITELPPNEWRAIDGKGLAAPTALSPKGHAQKLVGAIRAGQETFGLVAVRNLKSGDSKAFLTRFPREVGEESEFVGFIEKDKPLTIGRNGNKDYDETLSRDHFQVGILPDGRIGVIDEGSLNKTRIVERARHKIEIEPAPEEAKLAFGIFKRRAQQKTAKAEKPRLKVMLPDVLKDPEIWRGRSKDLKQELISDAVRERNEWLEQKLDDPQKPLPKLSLARISDDEPNEWMQRLPRDFGEKNDKTRTFELVNDEGLRVGAVVIKEPVLPPDTKSIPDKYYIGFIRAVSGKGYGPSAYLEVLKSLPEGIGLKSDGILSGDAKKMWEHMVEAGVAKKIDNGYPSNSLFETVF